MTDHYQYGIDLGTTNSVIARYDEGFTEVFGNPADFGRKTMPSVVGWDKGRLVVGSKAQERARRKGGGHNFVTGFKRRMGTSESFRIQSTGATVTPVELSTEVLKELRRFVTDHTDFSSAAITIPASFNTRQGNATTEAGLSAGVKHVALIQEPIAASLAYVNEGNTDTEDGKWLVYDLGGGTFDVALVEVVEDQLRVIDHEGDNYLGGRDFDEKILDCFVIPKLTASFTFSNLEEDLKNSKGRYNKVFEALLNAAEAGKIELSTRDSTEIDIDSVDFEDERGDSVSLSISIARRDFERLIRRELDRTLDITRSLLSRNKLRGTDLSFVLLVGGSTYIPCVRELIEQVIETPVKSDIDPTTVVAVGAAYYASSKTVSNDAEATVQDRSDDGVRLKAAYQRSSRDTEEYYAARIENWREGLRYRIVRQDGGYDSHWKDLSERIAEDLPLREREYNYFTIEVVDQHGRQVPVDGNEIAIAHGKVVSGGQPLSHDISLEKDTDDGRTVLDPLFRKNTALPVENSKTLQVNRTVAQGSKDCIRIRVLQGPHDTCPEACLRIGEMRLVGTELRSTLYKGADIEISASHNENNEVHISAHLPTIGQDFSEVFSGYDREVQVFELREDAEQIQANVDEALNDAQNSEDYERARQLKDLQRQTESLQDRLSQVTPDDGTDARYKADSEKQRLAADVARVTADKHLRASRQEYTELLSDTRLLVEQYGNDDDRVRLEELEGNEQVVSNSNSIKKIGSENSRVSQLYWRIQMRRPEVLQGIFERLCDHVSSMNEPGKAEGLVKQGREAIGNGDWSTVREVNHTLVNLLPSHAQAEMRSKIGFS